MRSFGSWVKNILFFIVYLFSGGTLVLIIDGVVTGTELNPFNTAVEEAMVHLRTPFLTQLFLFVTNIGSPFVLTCIAILLAIYLLLHDDTYDALLYILSILLAFVAFVVLKNTLHIGRPTNPLINLSSWSFPSGHATVSAAFFFATSYTFWGKFKHVHSKILLLLACGVGAAAISFSRLYLGVHYALDVLAGIALGICAVSMMILIFNIFLEEERWRRKRRGVRI